MKAAETQLYDTWNDAVRANDIIYLRGRQAHHHRRRRGRRRRNAAGSEVFWNVIFSALCLSVLVCLFLH
ncbi:MAG: hypothetical protein GX847_09770 [Clostridiales bacterium]|nr:hypothetical protein [Clostridiales bacterium]